MRMLQWSSLCKQWVKLGRQCPPPPPPTSNLGGESPPPAPPPPPPPPLPTPMYDRYSQDRLLKNCSLPKLWTCFLLKHWHHRNSIICHYPENQNESVLRKLSSQWKVKFFFCPDYQLALGMWIQEWFTNVVKLFIGEIFGPKLKQFWQEFQKVVLIINCAE